MPRFYPSEARRIAEKVIKEELTGKDYDEDDAKEWSLNIAERVKALVKGGSRGLRTTLAHRPKRIFISPLNLVPTLTPQASRSRGTRWWCR
jgi:hypothetical protein